MGDDRDLDERGLVNRRGEPRYLLNHRSRISRQLDQWLSKIALSCSTRSTRPRWRRSTRSRGRRSSELRTASTSSTSPGRPHSGSSTSCSSTSTRLSRASSTRRGARSPSWKPLTPSATGSSTKSYARVAHRRPRDGSAARRHPRRRLGRCDPPLPGLSARTLRQTLAASTAHQPFGSSPCPFWTTSENPQARARPSAVGVSRGRANRCRNVTCSRKKKSDRDPDHAGSNFRGQGRGWRRVCIGRDLIWSGRFAEPTVCNAFRESESLNSQTRPP